MDYMDWLAEQYEPRVVRVEEIESGKKDIKPLDFILLTSWSDLKTVAEAKTELKHSTGVEAEMHLDLTFVSCVYDDVEAGDGYEGSLVAVTPYAWKNDDPHDEFKTFLTDTAQEIGAVE